MQDPTSTRKNKIVLADYPYQKDIENRLLMSQFTTLDLEVLEEIIYSSLNIPIKKLAKNVDIDENELFPILEKFSQTSLLSYDSEVVLVDKEMRKYYEGQILKFDEDYQPGMEFLQSLLRKVPIHVLPTWYSIPRTSNNIFESLVEKYLLTPQIFQRYLMELHFSEPLLSSIVKDVYNAPDFKVHSKVLMDKYNLSKEQFEETLLQLEFNFVGCLGYEKINNTWKEIVTPYQEWREYLTFLKSTETTPLPPHSNIHILRTADFAFVQDMSAILQHIKKEPLATGKSLTNGIQLPPAALKICVSKCPSLQENTSETLAYINQIIEKLSLLKLADIINGRLYALDAANDFLDMPIENRALYLYRHPLNRILSQAFPPHLCTEKYIREAEKSIIRVLHKGWVYFEDFFKGVLSPLNDSSAIMLKKTGKTWKYALPEYSETDKAFVKAILFEWLFEIGMVSIGTAEGQECFCVTPFGQTYFGR